MSMSYELMMKKKGMPSRYQEVEYIESDGNAYIDTGLILGSNFEIEAEFISVGTGTDKPIFSSRVSGGNNEITLFTSYDKFQLKFGSSNTYVSGYSSNTKYNVKTDGQNWYIDGNLVQTFANTTTLTQPLYISAVKNEGATSPNFVGQHKFQLFKVKKNGSLIRNFIPVYDTLTQKYGMWESVQGKFYGNDGTGDFKGSIVGYTIVGSPTIVDGVVSGFSSANYLTLTLDKNVSNITEYVFKFKLTSEGLRNQYNYLFRRGNFQFSIYGTTTNFSGPTMYLPTYNQNVPLTGFIPIKDNWYWVKYTYDGTTVKLYSSTDGITWTIRNTVTNVTVVGNSGTFYLGFADTNVNSYFGGEIDMNNTYIKINNKLWFNGQQA